MNFMVESLNVKSVVIGYPEVYIVDSTINSSVYLLLLASDSSVRKLDKMVRRYGEIKMRPNKLG